MRLNAELKASVGTTCAAVLLVAALLLSTYLLNDWPARVLQKHASNATSGHQRRSHHHLWSDQCSIFVERFLLRF